MSKVAVKVRVSVAWWLWWYLKGVSMMCRFTGADPDVGKVSRVVSKAVRAHK